MVTGRIICSKVPFFIVESLKFGINVITKTRFFKKGPNFYTIFCLKFLFLKKISIFEKNFNFIAEFLFLNKISIFEQNFDF